MEEGIHTEIFFKQKFSKIIASLNDSIFFNRIKKEEEDYKLGLSTLSSSLNTKLLYKQRTIEQLYNSETQNTKELIDELTRIKQNNQTNNLSLDIIHKMEKAFFSLSKKIEKEKKIRLNEIKINNKIEIDEIIGKQENNIKLIKETRLTEINKILQEKKEQLEIINNYFETAPFDSKIWERVSFRNSVPIFNQLLIGEKLNSYTFYDKEIRYRVPKIVNFFTQNSLSIIYNHNTIKYLKPIVDQLVLRILMSAEAGNIEFYFFDAFGDSRLFLDYLDLPHELYNKKIYTSSSDIEKGILELQRIEDDITQHQLKSYGNIANFNKKNPKSIIPYRVVVFDSFPKGVTINLLPSIEKLTRIGSKAGIHFIFMVENTDIEKASSIIDKTEKYIVSDNTYIPDDNLLKTIKKQVIDLCDKQFNAEKSILFEEYCNEIIWKDSSSEKLTIPLGMNGANIYNFEFDQVSKSHALVTGQTGCGKSFLLHTLITSACLQYSPNELRLFLIDLKSGVEFQRYATHHLPHADFIALHGSPEFGIHILKQVTDKIKKRGEFLKKHGAKDLPDYKKLYPEKNLPRYLIIIDEYQEMFRDRSMRSEALDKIDLIAKQGRSFGFNLLLASQTVELPDDILSNFGLRIVMRTNAQIARRALDTYNLETGKLKAGQAIISDGYDIEKVQSFFLRKDPQHYSILEQIKNRWEEKGNVNYTRDLIIFNRDSLSYLTNNKTIIQQQINNESHTLHFSPGEKLMIDGQDFICYLTRENANNILVVGGKLDVSVRALNGTFLSIIPQLNIEKTEIKLLNFINQSSKDLFNAVKSTYNYIENRFNNSTYYDQSNIIADLLVNTISIIEERAKKLNTDSYLTPYLIVIYNIENSQEFREIQTISPLNKTITKKSEQTKNLIQILKNGPRVGVHCLIHTATPDSYYQVFNEDDDDIGQFQHRILLQMTQDDSKDFLGSYRKDAGNLVDKDAGSSGHNRAIYYDNFSQNFFDIIKPYEFLTDKELKNY